MNSITKILEKHALIPTKVTLKNNVKIVDSNAGRFVFKKEKKELLSTYNYLKSRAFDYFPNIINVEEGYNIFEYVEDIAEPKEQKIIDLVNVLSLLHLKTTFYKEIDIDEYKKIYEDVNNNLEYIYNYYNDVISIIENDIYMSPSEYLFARNISKVYEIIRYCKINIDKWYELIKDKRKIRVVQVHNNLSLDHYVKNDKPCFLSWEKNKIDMPIYDLYILYQNHYLDFEFDEILKQYESKYHLIEEERLLLFILLLIPKKFEFNASEYSLCNNARRFFDYIYKTEKLISEYSIVSTA